MNINGWKMLRRFTFILVGSLLLIDSRGKTKILGFVVMSIVVCVKIYGYYLSFLRTSLDAEAPTLKILYLLPFVWFLFESKKKKSFTAES